MNYWVLTPTGETGPYSVATLNRMHQKGEVRGDQMCRAEKATAVRRLDEVFRHWAPPQDVVHEARKNVAQWNQQAGQAAITGGLAMIGYGIFKMIQLGTPLAGIPFLVVGIGLLAAGISQLRRGKAGAARVAASQPQPKVVTRGEGAPPAPAEPPGPYNY
jgi:hypothetical protein